MQSKSVYTILREFGFSSEIAEKANNDIFDEIIKPLQDEIKKLHDDVELQSNLRRQAEAKLQDAKRCKPEKSFTGNLDTDVEAIIKKHLSVAKDPYGSTALWWDNEEII